VGIWDSASGSPWSPLHPLEIWSNLEPQVLTLDEG
jgi:hypothetical protein